MAVSRGLRRLLRIRELEEEQSRIALETSISELQRLERVRDAGRDREQGGRRLVEAGIRRGVLEDRLAGLEETRAGDRLVRALKPRIASGRQDVEELRSQFLERRVERRQAEALIEEAESRENLDAERRTQQALDDWFRSRQRSRRQEAARAGSRQDEKAELDGKDGSEISSVEWDNAAKGRS